MVAVDLDATLARYDGGYDSEVIGEVIPETLEKIRVLKQAGCLIVIFTCREDIR